MFLYTDQPVNLTVEVGFRGGEPWLYYPAATVAGVQGASKTVTWSGLLAPNATAQIPPVASSHWWNELRAVGASLFLSSEGTAERFLFYDGPVLFERPFVISRRPGGALVSPMSVERSLWLVDGATFTESVVERAPRGSTVVARGDMRTLRARLDQELRARGLSAAEARSLLETWRDDLFGSPSPRAISFVPRNLYDLMLPVRMDPQPAELVRVGLVIDEL